jgi:hypothetical protein
MHHAFWYYCLLGKWFLALALHATALTDSPGGTQIEHSNEDIGNDDWFMVKWKQ